MWLFTVSACRFATQGSPSSARIPRPSSCPRGLGPPGSEEAIEQCTASHVVSTTRNDRSTGSPQSMQRVSVESNEGRLSSCHLRSVAAFEMALHARLSNLQIARFGSISARTVRHFVEGSRVSIRHGLREVSLARSIRFHDPKGD